MTTFFKDDCDMKILPTEFLKVLYIIIQAIRSQKSTKKMTIIDEKRFCVF